ncbi:Rrf2 family transcriptional regulator [candidate division KSB1 bacterium]|nr:Rrf2 family transcriptional regulator [candidate division KSB1 bacterium]
MKLTFKSDYALHAILDLSCYFGTNKVVPLADICKRHDIPAKFLEQIMLILKKADYVESKRGSGGGFMVKKRPDEITLGEIIRQIDGSIEPSAGLKGNHSPQKISPEEQTAFEEVWANVARAISEVVDHVSFADIMHRVTELREQRADFNYVI